MAKTAKELREALVKELTEIVKQGKTALPPHIQVTLSVEFDGSDYAAEKSSIESFEIVKGCLIVTGERIDNEGNETGETDLFNENDLLNADTDELEAIVAAMRG